MSEPFVAEIRMFCFNFAPTGWAFCDGQLLPISQNTALFSLLGTQYGGDGKSTFALPNLQGSAPVNQGQGPGLSQYFVGESTGTSNVTLLQSEMPSHSHGTLSGSTGSDQVAPTGNAWGAGAKLGGAKLYAPKDTINPANNVQMNPLALSVAGGSLPHNNMQPYLGLNFCIALQGVFPPRS